MAQGHTEKGHLLYTCALDIIKCLSLMTIISRRIEIRGRIVKRMLSNCSEMIVLGTCWNTSVLQDVKELEKPGKVLSRDRPQRLFDVIVGTNQDSTDETRNTGKEKDRNQTITEGMSIDKSVERESGVSVLIKQICTESVSCPSVFYVSPACSACWNAA